MAAIFGTLLEFLLYCNFQATTFLKTKNILGSSTTNTYFRLMDFREYQSVSIFGAYYHRILRIISFGHFTGNPIYRNGQL